MAEHLAYVGDLTIASGATDSAALVNNQLAQARALVFETPSAFTSTVTLRGLSKKDSVIAHHIPVKVAGTAVTLTAAVRDEYLVSGMKSLSIHSSGAESADRVVHVYAMIRR